MGILSAPTALLEVRKMVISSSASDTKEYEKLQSGLAIGELESSQL